MGIEIVSVDATVRYEYVADWIDPDPPWWARVAEGIPIPDKELLFRTLKNVRNKYKQRAYEQNYEIFKNTGWRMCWDAVEHVKAGLYAPGSDRALALTKIYPPGNQKVFGQFTLAIRTGNMFRDRPRGYMVVDVAPYLFEGFGVGPYVPYESMPIAMGPSFESVASVLQDVYSGILGEGTKVDILPPEPHLWSW